MRVNPETLHSFPVAGMLQLHNGHLAEVPSGGTFPWRVLNRVFLHEIAACQMFTAIAAPHERLNNEILRAIAREASVVNAQIGLPTAVEDLFIRTREDSPYRSFGFHNDKQEKPRIAGTNPALQILGIHSRSPRFKQLKTEFSPEIKFNSVEEWICSINPSYLLIHEENQELQKKSIHGRIMSVDPSGPYELSIGTDALHARMIGLNGSRYVRVEGHDIRWLVESVLCGRADGVVDRSWDSHSAFKLMQRLEPYLDKLLHTLDRVQNKYGRNAVPEFRIYPDMFEGEPVLAGLQVYDLDQKLAR